MVVRYSVDANSFDVPWHLREMYDEIPRHEIPEEDRIYLDVEYREAVKKWEEWEACVTDADRDKFRTANGLSIPKAENPPHPDLVRSFKFLPLFKRIKL